jgi:hypothetical protein
MSADDFLPGLLGGNSNRFRHLVTPLFMENKLNGQINLSSPNKIDRSMLEASL